MKLHEISIYTYLPDKDWQREKGCTFLMTGRLCPSANALAPAANCMSKADGERQDVEVSTEFAKVSYDSDHFHILCFAF